MSRSGRIGSILLFIAIVAVGIGLATWKYNSISASNAAAASQPEPMDSVTVAVAKERMYRPSTTSIGTVTAIRSITLKNEVAGTVSKVHFTSGQIVEAGRLLIAMDVSVEQAELKEQEARATLAQKNLERMQRVSRNGAISELDVDRAGADRDIALAQIARTKAIIARKMIHAPFRARAGISDVQPGQYLNEGTQLTTLQGVDDAAYVDFAVAQQVAALLQDGDTVNVFEASGSQAIAAKIVAMEARIDPTTRNATMRAKIEGGASAPSPGASVRVEVPAGPERKFIAVPVISLRKGPQGDHVFVITKESDGKTRAHMRQVESGAILGDEVLIISGLSTGEQVASSGSFKLREGSLVAVTF